jgi:ubiquinone/menaquinone biosynthesis C-methylase UbiE
MKGQVSRVTPSPDPFWDTYSRYYDCVYHLMPYRKLLWDAYETLDLSDGMRVLDAGCGTGNFEHFIAEKDPPQVRIHAVDSSPAMLAKAREKCHELDFATFSPADLDAVLPFPDDTFDRIVSINVLYALRDRNHAMRELLRVLKPEGKMVLTSPAPGYRWGPLVVDHFSRVRNIWGTRRKASNVLNSIRVLSTSALGSFLLNVFVIYRRERAGQFHALDEDELQGLLDEHRKYGLEDFSIEPAFARQNLFATAMKEAPVGQS